MLVSLLCLAVAQGDTSTALDQLLVLERVRPLTLSKSHFHDFFALAVRTLEAHEEAAKKLGKLREQEAALTPILANAVEAKPQTATEITAIANAKNERRKVLSAETTQLERLIDTAILKLTEDQRVSLVDERAKARMADLASKVFTATNAEWPQVRHHASSLIADTEKLRIYGEATAAWEKKTGKRFDVPGGPTIDDLGIKDELDQVQKSAEEYVAQARRGRGASKDELRRRMLSGQYKDFDSIQKVRDAIRFILDSKGSVAALKTLAEPNTLGR